MALADIINRIAQDAESESQQKLAAASARAEQLLGAARVEAGAHRERTLETGKRDAASKAATIVASARLEARDHALLAKREVVTTALTDVVRALEALPDDRYARFLAVGIADAIRAGDTVALAAEDARHADAIREAVRSAQPDIEIEWDETPAPVSRGALITGPRTRVEVTPASVVETHRDELELKVTGPLFSEEGS